MAPKSKKRELVEDNTTDRSTVAAKLAKLVKGASSVLPVSVTSTANKKLQRPFYDVPCVTLAKALLGQRLVRTVGSKRLSGRIVETEAYLGFEDKAAHSYNGKRTERSEAMYMQPGTAYVYNIYGMYYCLNISSKGEGAAVLIRALEAVEGKEEMKVKRSKKSTKIKKDKELTNGPSKLAQALEISKAEFNKVDMTNSNSLWLERDEDFDPSQIVTSKRINIGYAEEWANKTLRFYILGNEYVSSRDKSAESVLCTKT